MIFVPTGGSYVFLKNKTSRIKDHQGVSNASAIIYSWLPVFTFPKKRKCTDLNMV
jgi:hypothetical protein